MNKLKINTMFSAVINNLLVIVICLQWISPAVADYEEFLEKMKIEELYQTLGPKKLLSTLLDQTKSKNLIDATCSRDLISYKQGIEEQESWAVRMLDSSSKIPPGLLIGNVIEMGMYDECQNVHVYKNGSEIVGNHCMYILYLSYKNQSLPINPMLSICIPLSCNETDLRTILDKRFQTIGGYEKFNISSIDVICSTDHTNKWVGSYVIITIGSAFFLLLLIFTIIDLLKEKNAFTNDIPQVICELSLYKNIRSIMSFKDSPGSITVLHGLRTLSTTTIILGHGILMRAMSVHANNTELTHFPVIVNIIVALVMYGVDTFLTISGFLLSYSFLKKYSSPSQGKLNLDTYYLHRYIRLTPAIVATLLASIYLVPFMGSGPKWRKFSRDMTSDSCKEMWWTILLYVNNFAYPDNNCMPHLWSTAVDMQLFWISPLILYPLAKKPKLGLLLLGLLCVISIAIPAAVIAINYFPFSMETGINMNFDHLLKMFDYIYTPTYTRAGPWLIGILLGYIVLKGPQKLHKTTIFIGWSLTTSFCLFCIAGYCISVDKHYVYDVTWESTFGSISRPIWSISIAWIIFTAIRGYGGIVTRFLSLPIFYPLSRLSYCLYLVHLFVQVLNSQSVRTPTYFRMYFVLIGFIDDMVLSLVVAMFFCIVFEMPARTLERFILNPSTKNRQPQVKLDEKYKENEEKV